LGKIKLKGETEVPSMMSRKSLTSYAQLELSKIGKNANISSNAVGMRNLWAAENVPGLNSVGSQFQHVNSAQHFTQPTSQAQSGYTMDSEGQQPATTMEQDSQSLDDIEKQTDLENQELSQEQDQELSNDNQPAPANTPTPGPKPGSNVRNLNDYRQKPQQNYTNQPGPSPTPSPF